MRGRWTYPPQMKDRELKPKPEQNQVPYNCLWTLFRNFSDGTNNPTREDENLTTSFSKRGSVQRRQGSWTQSLTCTPCLAGIGWTCWLLDFVSMMLGCHLTSSVQNDVSSSLRYVVVGRLSQEGESGRGVFVHKSWESWQRRPSHSHKTLSYDYKIKSK